MNENERSSGRTQVPQSDQNSETPRTAQLDNDIESLTIEVFFDCKILSFLAFFLFFIFPLLPLFLATVFGGLFALCEPDTTFKQGFLYVVSNLLGMGNPLTSYNPSYTSVAIVIDMYVAITALVCFGIMLNVVNLFQVPEAMNSLIERVTKNTFLVPLIALGVFIPIWNAVLCVVFGSLLALAEGWTIRDGILYVFTNILGLTSPLTNVSPSTILGAIIDVMISSTALGFLAIFADYVTVLNPSSYVRKNFRLFLAWCGIIELTQTTERHPLSNGNGHHYNNEQPHEVLDGTKLPRPPSQTNMSVSMATGMIETTPRSDSP